MAAKKRSAAKRSGGGSKQQQISITVDTEALVQLVNAAEYLSSFATALMTASHDPELQALAKGGSGATKTAKKRAKKSASKKKK